MVAKRKCSDINIFASSDIREDDQYNISAAPRLLVGEELKSCLLGDKFTIDWRSALSRCREAEKSIDQRTQEAMQEAAQIKQSLQEQIEQSHMACEEECEHLFRLNEEVQNKIVEVEEIHQSIRELEESEARLKEHIHNHKVEASEHVHEMDLVEAERMQQVPKLKNQISMYAETTGIKWDYSEMHLLAGHVAVPSMNMISRFEFDPHDHTKFEIANYLWAEIEGNHGVTGITAG